MRKVILFDMISLDGFFEGPERDIHWHNVDEEFNAFSIEQIDAADCLIFGRMTYETMAAYWPTPAAAVADPLVAKKMNSLPKIIFSRTLVPVTWNNTRLFKGNAAEELLKLKGQPGKDMIIFGSADLACTLFQHGLIDEFRLLINPLVLGGGTPLFQDIQHPVQMNLVHTRAFRNGNVLLCYQPCPESAWTL